MPETTPAPLKTHMAGTSSGLLSSWNVSKLLFDIHSSFSAPQLLLCGNIVPVIYRWIWVAKPLFPVKQKVNLNLLSRGRDWLTTGRISRIIQTSNFLPQKQADLKFTLRTWDEKTVATMHVLLQMAPEKICQLISPSDWRVWTQKSFRQFCRLLFSILPPVIALLSVRMRRWSLWKRVLSLYGPFGSVVVITMDFVSIVFLLFDIFFVEGLVTDSE